MLLLLLITTTYEASKILLSDNFIQAADSGILKEIWANQYLEFFSNKWKILPKPS